MGLGGFPLASPVRLRIGTLILPGLAVPEMGLACSKGFEIDLYSGSTTFGWTLSSVGLTNVES